MKGKIQFIGMAAFLVLVLGGIAFLLLQEEGALPDTPQASTRAAKQTPAVETASSPKQDAAPAGDATEALESAPEAALASDQAPAEDAPATKSMRPRGPGSIKGIVTWHSDGAPVSGAEIHLDYINRPKGYDPYPEERAEWTAESDARGSSRLPTFL